jgi:outer membrane receptor protein involved in Fe transport
MKLTLTNEAESVQHDPILAGDVSSETSYNTLGAILTSKISPRINNKFGISYLDTSVKQQLTQLGHVFVNEDLLFVRDHLTVATGENNEILFGVDYGLTNVRLDLDVPMVVPSDWIPPVLYTGAPRFVGTDRFTVNSWGIALKDRWKISEPLTLVFGGRASYDDYLDKHVVEPKLSAEYYVMKDTLVTAGWGRYHQFPAGYQVIEGFGNPHLDYEKADHYDVGVEQQVSNGWSIKVDEYYKKLYSLVIPYQPENYINGGSGKAYGTEILIKKSLTTDWWGWLSVGYSKTERNNDITGEKFSTAYDQPYIINLVYTWKITPKWTFGAKWRYQSGAPFTPVIGTDTSGRPNYGPLGSERLPAYHRLDLRVSAEVWSGMQKVSFYVDLINAYNHKNISGYDYNADYTSRKSITELPILPAVGVQMAF